MEKRQIREMAGDSRKACGRGTFRAQRGLVLLVTLLVLVAMMLASVGIMRSIDASTMAVGNMAFRQAAEASANQAIETAVRSLATGVLAGSATNDHVSPFYFASYDPANDDAQGIPGGRLAGVSWVKDASGNITRTLVERMCSAIGVPAPPAVVCQVTGSVDSDGSDDGGALSEDGNKTNERPNAFDFRSEEEKNGSKIITTPAILYRISVRVDGPNGTVTYAQAMVDRL